MDHTGVRDHLIAIIGEIQQLSGLECPKLDGKSRPVDIVPNFKSPLWAVAATLLSERLKVDIPDDTNLFYDQVTKATLSIDESVGIVTALIDALKPKAEE